MEEMNNLLVNEEVMESVVEEVIETKTMSVLGQVGLGVGIAVAAIAIVKVTPKVTGFIRNKIEERRENKQAEDYVTEELKNEESETKSEEE